MVTRSAMWRPPIILVSIVLLIASGCGQKAKVRAIGPNAFVSGSKGTIPSDPLSGVDNPGAIVGTTPRPSGQTNAGATSESDVDGINPTVRANVKTPAAQN